jgi:hypothetical protein
MMEDDKFLEKLLSTPHMVFASGTSLGSLGKDSKLTYKVIKFAQFFLFENGGIQFDGFVWRNSKTGYQLFDKTFFKGLIHPEVFESWDDFEQDGPLPLACFDKDKMELNYECSLGGVYWQLDENLPVLRNYENKGFDIYTTIIYGRHFNSIKIYSTTGEANQ